MYFVFHSTLHVLGYGFCISLLNFKFSFYSWFILRFLCSTKIVSHFLRNFCRTRFFLLFVKRTAHSLILSRAFVHGKYQMRESERALSGNPFAHVDPKGWKISLSNYRTKIFLFCILYSYWLVYPERGGKVRGVIN